MLKEKISLKRLVGLSQEDGEKLLLAAGYIQDNTYCDDEDCIEGQRYHDDTYYSLYDEDGQEIDTKSWTTTYEKAADRETVHDNPGKGTGKGSTTDGSNDDFQYGSRKCIDPAWA